MDPVLFALVLIAVGVFIGFCSGLLGIGGGSLMVPIFRLFLGIDAYAATATSLFTMVFTSISGAVSHIQQKTCIVPIGIALGIGGCVTSALGAYLGSISPSWAIMLVTALIVAYSATNMLRKALSMPKNKWRQKGGAEKSQAKTKQTGAGESGEKAVVRSLADEDFEVTPKRVAGALCIGLFAGLCAGYAGIGGGFIMVPLMTTLLAVPMYKASGTSTIAIIILSIPGIIEQAMLGHVLYMVGICVAIGSIPGAAIGARFVKKIPERQLRLIFAFFLFIAAIALVINELLESGLL